MKNVLAAFLFAIINLALQIALHMFPFIGKAFPSIKNLLQIAKLVVFNTSSAALLYDIFMDIGSVKYLLYVIALGTLVASTQEIVKPSYLIVLAIVFGMMIGVSYFLCYFRDSLDIYPCLMCDYDQKKD